MGADVFEPKYLSSKVSTYPSAVVALVAAAVALIAAFAALVAASAAFVVARVEALLASTVASPAPPTPLNIAIIVSYKLIKIDPPKGAI